jgi:hypothetical protein
MKGHKMPSTTQQAHPWRATVRTIIQMVLGLAVAAPLIIEAITGQSAAMATGAAATILAISAAFTRLMAIPVVDDLLAKIGLSSGPKVPTT